MSYDIENAAELRGEIMRLEQIIRVDAKERAMIAAQRDKLRGALEFYADESAWCNDAVDIGVGDMEVPGSSEAANDRGRRARDALGMTLSSFVHSEKP